MKEKLIRFMQGRYGIDGLNRFLIALTFALILVSAIFKLHWLIYLAYVTLIIYILRMLSCNIAKRYQENVKYQRIAGKFTGAFRLLKQRWTDRRDYRYFKCPQCHANMRVPKGRGKIRITCRCCGHQFERNS